eukprot:258063-Rhodomonas_salina.2
MAHEKELMSTACLPSAYYPSPEQIPDSDSGWIACFPRKKQTSNLNPQPDEQRERRVWGKGWSPVRVEAGDSGCSGCGVKGKGGE